MTETAGAPDVRRERVEAGGLTFDVDLAGPGDGVPVVLLHGFPQGPRTWAAVRDRLAGQGCRVVVPAQRGYSPGARPAESSAYRLPLLAGDVLGIADRLGLGRFHVAGHDWGGAVAWQLAGAHPDRLLTMTSASTPHPTALARSLATSAQAARSSYMLLFRTPVLAELVLGARGNAGLAALLRAGGLRDEAAAGYARDLADPGALTATLNWYRAIRPGDLLRVPPARVPAQLVWGPRDTALGPRAAYDSARYARGPYRFTVLPGAGHWLPERRAEQVAVLLLSWLSSYPEKIRS